MSSIEKKAQRQTLLHFWNDGAKSAKELHILTKIPLSTIYYNIEKLKKKQNKTGDVSRSTSHRSVHSKRHVFATENFGN